MEKFEGTFERTPSGATVVTGKDAITLFQLVAMRGALKLEMLGMRHSRGIRIVKVLQRLGITKHTKKPLAMKDLENRIAEMEQAMRDSRGQ